jgi:DNA-binding PadR family transcriptional regulator
MLKPIPLHILLTLAEGESHGYAIMQAIRGRTGATVAVQTASFYRHLEKLIDDGWVAEAPGPRDGDDPRRGSYYRLTARGRQALAEERRRLTELVAQMKKVRLSPRKADV